MSIDIDRLTEAELIDLNNRVVARLKFLHEMRAHASMLQFRIGERVRFQPDGHPELTGIITKYNRKSVTVITENGQHRNVAPVFLRKAEAMPEPNPERGQVINLPKK
jgi:protein involved in polysaccharide export with SLBB domain